jgi:hypothetical protein
LQYHTNSLHEPENQLPPHGHEFIYLLTRSDSHMKYVGRTRRCLLDRLNEHFACGTMGDAAREAISIEVLEVAPVDVSRNRERHWIQSLHTSHPQHGFNRRAA